MLLLALVLALILALVLALVLVLVETPMLALILALVLALILALVLALVLVLTLMLPLILALELALVPVLALALLLVVLLLMLVLPLAQITQWLKESKLNNSKISNYEVQERILCGHDRDWELRALATVGRVTRLIAAGLKNAGGGNKRKSPSDPGQEEIVDEVVPSNKHDRKSKRQKAKDTIRGTKRVQTAPPAPAPAVPVPKSIRVKHSWAVLPVSASEKPASLVCEGSRKRKASSRWEDE